ncbi:HD domain-containing phosphohydrolase [Pseudomonas sp. NW5]|uniref:HD domain-containing phosphohydrolase n=1 Tax=Pseudomonas sp. NW5 TaxID=2934934 RepID=UPI0020224B68|nr:HD domain-containing phosphohydrolase [Pseudomonas sp. NW5]MCL7462950.1 phosphohydrolase [Pseudomonas sp. NW5]
MPVLPARGVALRHLTALAVVASMLVLGLGLLLQGQKALHTVLLSAASDDVERVGDLISERAGHMLAPARSTLSLLQHDPITRANSLPERLQRLPVLAATLEVDPTLSAVYIGYANGDFLLVRPLPRSAPALKAQAPAGAHYLVQSITYDRDGQMRGEWLFHDRQLQLLEHQQRSDYRFDPRSRPWYQQALARTDSVMTSPYLFFTSGEIGISLALRAHEPGSVLGMDASIQALSDSAATLRMTPGTQIAVLDSREQVFIYHAPDQLLRGEGSERRLAALQELPAPALQHLQASPVASAQAQLFRVGDEEWYGMRRELQAFGEAELLVSIPQDELFVAARELLSQHLLLGALILLPLLLAGAWFGRRLGEPLNHLASQLEALSHFDFEQPPRIRSRIREVQQLSDLLQRMAGSLHHLQKLTRTLNRERHLPSLIAQVLDPLIRITGTGGGAIYLLDETDGVLHCASQLHAGHYPPQLTGTTPDDRADPLLLAWLHGQFPPDTYLSTLLRGRHGELLGVLLLHIPEQAAGKRTSAAFQRFVEEVAGAAAVAIETRQLIESQQRLTDAIIHLLADTIDTKSEHTGAHCERVPQLALQLLDAANTCQTGRLADFSVDEEQRYAFSIAAWLHDCGKITTPSHIVDKATKLEAPYNRLHEIRTRFEVLWRDAELDYWQARQTDGDDDALRQQLQQRQAQLQADFAFVAHCNLGSEGMSEDDLQRLQQIARQRWWRHFDNRLGLSREEQEQLHHVPVVELPCAEWLIADRPEHCQPWGERRPPVERDDPRNRWQFDMQLPAYAQHLGELYNLSIRKGTLNAEERFRINEHIVQTLIMLDSLPFPASLRQVPQIAASHHEKLDGSGYPRRLDARRLGVPERILAIADVFEALTAADRPYKPAMPLSQVLRIMVDMVKASHLDGDLLQLFIQSELYLHYARQHLRSTQLDTPDTAALLDELVQWGLAPEAATQNP